MTKKVMIDPGHAPGNVNRGPTGYYEYQGMWKLSNYLKEELTKRGVQADLTRTKNQDPSLSERGKKSRGYDMFISEHSNAHNGKVRGVEVFYSLQRPGDKVHAQALSKAISTVMNNPNRDAKTQQYPNKPGVDYHGVIRAAASVGCPHIFLVENGFHDNPQDEAWLKNDQNLRALAEVQADVICNILGVKPQDETLYRVQVGAFKVRANADKLADELKKKGYDAIVVADKTDSQNKDVIQLEYKGAVKKGTKGEHVKELQKALKLLGYYKDAIDGSAGPNTVAAIKAFQKANGLTVDGSAGPATYAKLNEVLRRL